ncbi:hypothetical protein [Lactococcus fujiensis]|uniref:hypothetical protein n=1 Tax=Lactococcus fujiensis TaxID=610251 RepID=UPI000A9948B6|nr:hypothetical protein [Lactococcus fujiensis]
MKKLTKGSSEKNKSNVQLEPIFHQKNFIWDFDGTLFNTYPVMLEALKQAMILNKVSFEGDLAVYIKQHSIKTFAERFANQPFLDDYHRLESELQKKGIDQKSIRILQKFWYRFKRMEDRISS